MTYFCLLLRGVLATLLGVGLGGVLTRRQQVDAWSRDRQVDACAEIVRASAQVLRALRDLYLARIAQMDLDWRPWTEALAVGGIRMWLTQPTLWTKRYGGRLTHLGTRAGLAKKCGKQSTDLWERRALSLSDQYKPEAPTYQQTAFDEHQ